MSSPDPFPSKAEFLTWLASTFVIGLILQLVFPTSIQGWTKCKLGFERGEFCRRWVEAGSLGPEYLIPKE